MPDLRAAIARSALASVLVCGALSAATTAGDLSRYREFKLGASLAAVAKQTGASPSQAKTIDRRPALIQELEWRPQPLAWSSKTEPAQEVTFRFYDGELFQIEVNYDRYATEGLTADDIAGAISSTFGVAAKPPASPKAAEGAYGDTGEVVAQWQDAQCRFDLIRFSYGPTFRLTGVLKRLEGPAQTAILEARRLDDQEAPQRDAARAATEEAAARAKLEKARLVNKPNFRP
jgi:hypothetical protein